MNGFRYQFEFKSLLLALQQYFRNACLAREEQDSGGREHFLDRDRKFNTIHSRHEHIREQIVGMKPGHSLQSLPTVICRGDLKSRHFENLGQSIGDAAFIIDDEDLRKILPRLPGVVFNTRKADDERRYS
jgi:hypothetical protein